MSNGPRYVRCPEYPEWAGEVREDGSLWCLFNIRGNWTNMKISDRNKGTYPPLEEGDRWDEVHTRVVREMLK